MEEDDNRISDLVDDGCIRRFFAYDFGTGPLFAFYNDWEGEGMDFEEDAVAHFLCGWDMC
ncbi:hypothetical protein JCM15548_13862 [Geofilum rubicundum JCM 15548]|uniref:Uncharacterized protein n=1 Tax=Geofilum rubicundum JCM 15548 TaxID=1236989 RepID=A0A0E9M119_9BACT|nr:hypothetical protein JCM15548_13862 [Geofilum rubicundum JCM 15548]